MGAHARDARGALSPAGHDDALPQAGGDRPGYRSRMPATLELDHLVVAVRSLEEGARWLEMRVGLAPDPGGRHLGFGTHNALLRLGPDVYLEVLAPDPEPPRPDRPLLFGLGDPGERALLERGPRLVHWAVRVRDLRAAAAALTAAAGVDASALGDPTPLRRGDLAWALTVRADGSRPPAGLPSLIDWGSTPHPCTRLPDRDAALERLEIAAPAASLAALSELRSDARIAFSERATPRLEARVRTPRGVAILA
jgi:hypothetical protein